jgi:hypothetical protein
MRPILSCILDIGERNDDLVTPGGPILYRRLLAQPPFCSPFLTGIDLVDKSEYQLHDSWCLRDRAHPEAHFHRYLSCRMVKYRCRRSHLGYVRKKGQRDGTLLGFDQASRGSNWEAWEELTLLTERWSIYLINPFCESLKPYVMVGLKNNVKPFNFGPRGNWILIPFLSNLPCRSLLDRVRSLQIAVPLSGTFSKFCGIFN